MQLLQKKLENRIPYSSTQNLLPETIIKQSKTVGQHSKWHLTLFQLNNNQNNANKKMAKIY